MPGQIQRIETLHPVIWTDRAALVAGRSKGGLLAILALEVLLAGCVAEPLPRPPLNRWRRQAQRQQSPFRAR